MLEKLKEEVCRANIELKTSGLVIYTWGNVSAIDRDSGLLVIKPSGVPYDKLKAADMIVLDLEGNIVEGKLRPSSDTPTHIELYKAYKDVGAVVHTHSTFATAWAQSGRDLPVYGTTHADYFATEIPCTRNLTDGEVFGEYEKNTGLCIIEEFAKRSIKPSDTPAVLCKNHGPFTFGKDASNAVYNSVVLEEIAKMAAITLEINRIAEPATEAVRRKHYERKHGKNAYYGQEGDS